MIVVTPTPESALEACQRAMEAGSQRGHVERWHDASAIAEKLREM